MPTDDETLLRDRLADLMADAPAIEVSHRAVVAMGARRQARHRTVTAGAVVAVLLAGGVGIAAVTRPTRDGGPAVLTSMPTRSATTATVPGDRIGGYLATVVPAAHAGTEHQEILSFRAGSCVGSPEDARTSPATVGCWSPSNCPASGLDQTCDAGLVVVLDEPGPLPAEHPRAGLTGDAPVTVHGRPGVTTASTDGTTRTISWTLPGGLLATAHATGVSAADLLRFADGLIAITHFGPDGSASPAPEGTAQPATLDGFSTRANDVQSLLARVGASDPAYATVVIDHSDQTIDVYRVGGQPTPGYRRVDTEGIPLVFKTAKLTQEQSHELLTTIENAGSTLSSQDANVVSTSTDYTGNVTVTLQTDSSQAEQAVRALAPAGEAADLIFKQGTATAHF